MKLYHTTDKKFSKIDLSKSRSVLDFGKGFYVTDDYSIAEEFLKNKRFTNPFIKIYLCEVFDNKNIFKKPFSIFKDIKIANLNKVGKIEVLATLFHYRKLYYDFKGLLNEDVLNSILDCDIIIGKIMDKNFANLYKDLLENRNIPLFLSKMNPYRGNQYAFKNKAIKYLIEKSGGLLDGIRK